MQAMHARKRAPKDTRLGHGPNPACPVVRTGVSLWRPLVSSAGSFSQVTLSRNLGLNYCMDSACIWHQMRDACISSASVLVATTLGSAVLCRARQLGTLRLRAVLRDKLDPRIWSPDSCLGKEISLSLSARVASWPAAMRLVRSGKEARPGL